MTRLVALLREYSGAIEADLDHFYGKDLRDLWRGGLTPRAVMVRIDNLPPGAALWRAIGNDDAWSDETHMLANVVDLVAGGNWQRVGSKGPHPTPVQRPSEAKRVREIGDRHALRAQKFLARQEAAKQRGDLK